jgi:hypothetical protein
MKSVHLSQISTFPAATTGTTYLSKSFLLFKSTRHPPCPAARAGLLSPSATLGLRTGNLFPRRSHPSAVASPKAEFLPNGSSFRENTALLPDPRALLPQPRKAPLLIACPLQALVPSGKDRPFHTTLRIYTASFAPPVTVVGKQGHLSLQPGHISKRPQLHNPDLENGAQGQPPPDQLLRQNFHFSALNYGYYCHLYVFSFLIPFPPVPARHPDSLQCPAFRSNCLSHG